MQNSHNPNEQIASYFLNGIFFFGNYDFRTIDLSDYRLFGLTT